MSDLTDLEICKRIAEIEGHEKSLFEGVGERDFYIKCHPMNAIRYNPLTDDALCFQLMVKQKIKFLPYVYGDAFKAEWFDGEDYLPCVDKSPNRAICLAIIEANKDK